MESIGTVVKTEGNEAVVSVNRVSACGENCAHCKGGCSPSKAYTTAKNEAFANVGDVVKIETKTEKVIKAAVILYFVPLMLSIISACIAYAFNVRTWIIACVTAIVFIVPFFVIKKFERKITPVSKITKVIKRKA